MKEVSRRYKTAMKKPFRNRSHCVVTFGNTDITAITDGVWSGDAEVQSSYDTIDYEHTYGDTIGFLELNRWSLDGKTIIDGGNTNDGFISELTDEPKIIKTFTVPHSFVGVTLDFDTRENEYPFAVELKYIDGGEEQSVVAYPTSTNSQIVLQGNSVERIEITFLCMLPNRRARLQKTTWGVSAVFSDNQLSNVKQSHDVDPISRRLPTEKMDVTVFDYEHLYDPDNPQGIYNYINKGTPITVTYGIELDDGTIEWAKPDTYSLMNTPSFKNEKVTFQSVGLIQTLNGKYYKGIEGSKNLYDLAEAILTDALENGYIYPMADGSNPWEIDSALEAMTTDFIVPIDTYANILQMIAHAARSRFYTSDDNVIHIKPFGITPIGIFNGVYTDNGHLQVSEWNTVDYGEENNTSMATLELNRFVLDGKFTTNVQREGFIAEDASFVDGSNDSVFGKEFDVSHDLPITTINFDTLLDEYPYELSVSYYRKESLIKTEYVYPDSSVFSINTEFVSDCDRISIEATAMLPYTRTRVGKVSFRETDFSITLDDVKENTATTTKIEKLRNVVVNEYHYEESSSASELYKKEITVAEQQVVHIEFSAATDIDVSIAGGTAIEQNVYAQAADIKLNPGTYTITVSGKTLSQKPTEIVFPVNNNGDDDIESNPLITNRSMATALGEHIKAYLTLRNTYDENYRGNPELEVGDIIELETLYSQVVYGLVLVDEITYNGALSGKVKVKGLA